MPCCAVGPRFAVEKRSPKWRAAAALLVGLTHSWPKGALNLGLLDLTGLVAHIPAPVRPPFDRDAAGTVGGQPAGPSYHGCRSCRASPMKSATTEVTTARQLAWFVCLGCLGYHDPLRKSVSHSRIYINIMLPISIRRIGSVAPAGGSEPLELRRIIDITFACVAVQPPAREPGGWHAATAVAWQCHLILPDGCLG